MEDHTCLSEIPASVPEKAYETPGSCPGDRSRCRCRSVLWLGKYFGIEHRGLNRENLAFPRSARAPLRWTPAVNKLASHALNVRLACCCIAKPQARMDPSGIPKSRNENMLHYAVPHN